MQLHVESSDPAAIEFCEMLGALGLAQQHVAELFGVGLRNVRRWRSGDRRIPHGVGIVLRLLAAGTVTVAQVEQAAVPARANSGVKVEPLASLLVDPAPEQSALAHASTATADARATSPSVRIPVGFCCSSRYAPIKALVSAAAPNRKIMSSQSLIR